METDWTRFLLPYKKTTSELKSKFISLQEEYKLSGQHVPIESVTARVKPRESIIEKMNRRNILEKNLDVEMEDIAGIRVMCQFVDDIYQLVEVIRKRSDLVVIEERDYIANEKESGYRSYHLIIKYPVQLLIGQKEILAEIQIRTLAMNFWATIEHSLNYKYKGKFPEELGNRLKRAAEAAYQLDQEMFAIREEIKEAQQEFSYRRRNEKN